MQNGVTSLHHLVFVYVHYRPIKAMFYHRPERSLFTVITYILTIPIYTNHTNLYRLVVWNILSHILGIIWNAHPNWLSYFFRGVGIPPTSILTIQIIQTQSNDHDSHDVPVIPYWHQGHEKSIRRRVGWSCRARIWHSCSMAVKLSALGIPWSPKRRMEWLVPVNDGSYRMLYMLYNIAILYCYMVSIYKDTKTRTDPCPR